MAGAKRVELYTMLTRLGNLPLPPDGAAVVQYEVRLAKGGRFVERVSLMNEKDGWRPAAYECRAIPAL
jgi:hypothetical protein